MKYFFFIVLISIAGCNTKSSNNEEIKSSDTNPKSTMETISDYSISYGVKKLNLSTIQEQKEDLLRVWHSPEGGTLHYEMFELVIQKQELIHYSYIGEMMFEGEESSEKLNFRKIINNENLISELIEIVKNDEFIKLKDMQEYCGINWSPTSLYIIEYSLNKKTGSFIMERRDCYKKIPELMNKLKNLVINIRNE